MANGEPMDPEALTVAHKTLAFGTKVLLYTKHKSVLTTVTDRGPFIKGREFDLSPAVFQEFAPLARGTTHVFFKIVGQPDPVS